MINFSVFEYFLMLTFVLHNNLVPFHIVQWIPVNRDSDKGDFRLIGIEIGNPFTK